jgi:hypothetical protein
MTRSKALISVQRFSIGSYRFRAVGAVVLFSNLGTWTAPVLRICCRIPGCTDHKAIPSANFQKLGRILLLFEFGPRPPKSFFEDL